MELDINFYRSVYYDIENMNDFEVIMHWKSKGCNENRLPNREIFYFRYPDFKYKEFMLENILLGLTVENLIIAYYWHIQNLDYIPECGYVNNIQELVKIQYINSLSEEKKQKYNLFTLISEAKRNVKLNKPIIPENFQPSTEEFVKGYMITTNNTEDEMKRVKEILKIKLEKEREERQRQEDERRKKEQEEFEMMLKREEERIIQEELLRFEKNKKFEEERKRKEYEEFIKIQELKKIEEEKLKEEMKLIEIKKRLDEQKRKEEERKKELQMIQDEQKILEETLLFEQMKIQQIKNLSINNSEQVIIQKENNMNIENPENNQNQIDIQNNVITENLKFYNIEELIQSNYQILTSESLKHLAQRITKKFNLNFYSNTNAPTIFFGIYLDKDIKNINNHKGVKYLLWGGSDVDNIDLLKGFKGMPNTINLAISKNIYARLDKMKMNPQLVKLNLVDKSLFKPVDKYGDKIFVYNGLNPGNEDKYGNYQEIIKRFPEFNVIYSNTLKKKYELMPNIYQECFVGLRLTKNDGNANSTQELISMNIPVIHNGDDPESIKWETLDDVELNVRYANIDRIYNNYIKEHKFIFVYCTDYPSWGGAATNTAKLIEWLRHKNHNVFGYFYHSQTMKNDYFHITNEHIKPNFKPSLIILRNYAPREVVTKWFPKAKVLFLVPGLFRELENNDYKKYINKDILDTTIYCDEIFVNSYKTQKILKDYFDIKSQIFYFNYVTYYSEKIKKNDGNRPYKYGVIISDFNRQIKNVGEIKNYLLQFPNEKKIAIGKNSIILADLPNIEIHDLMEYSKLLTFYPKIENVINFSHFESCSNVLVEAKYAGCNCIVKE